MTFLLADAARITNDQMVKGVIETLITESSVLALLPFVDVSGTQLTWGKENAASAAPFHAVDGTWTATELTVAQGTAALAIIGGDADVDNYLQQTYRNPNDLAAEVITEKAKEVAYTYQAAFFNGTGASNQFTGLSVAAGAVQTTYGALTVALRAWSEGANGATLTLDYMDKVIDAIKRGRPDALFCSKRTRRKLATLRRASGALLETWRDMSGRHQWAWDGIPLYVDENITDTETQGSSTDCSSIYACQFGFRKIVGIMNGGIQVETVGKLETKDATRRRVKMYAGLAIMAPLSYVRFAGVRD